MLLSSERSKSVVRSKRAPSSRYVPASKFDAGTCNFNKIIVYTLSIGFIFFFLTSSADRTKFVRVLARRPPSFSDPWRTRRAVVIIVVVVMVIITVIIRVYSDCRHRSLYGQMTGGILFARKRSCYCFPSAHRRRRRFDRAR